MEAWRSTPSWTGPIDAAVTSTRALYDDAGFAFDTNDGVWEGDFGSLHFRYEGRRHALAVTVWPDFKTRRTIVTVGVAPVRPAR